MDALTSEQEAIGKSIEQLIQGFKGDPSYKKELPYLRTRIVWLDTDWVKFDDNHNKLTPYADTHQEHPYFKKGYYASVKRAYEQFKATLQEAIEAKSADTRQLAGPAQTSNQDQSEGEGQQPSGNNEVNDHNDPSFTCTNDSQGQKTELNMLLRIHKTKTSALVQHLKLIENGLPDHHPRAYYELKLKCITDYWTSIAANYQKILNISVEGDESTYDENYYIQLESWVQDIAIGLSSKLEALPGCTLVGRQIKLPKITLPTFDGNYLHWSHFRGLYVQMVHDQPITDAEKMFYLQGNLTGEAKALIQHIPSTGENYQSAWTTLEMRYNNKRLLVTALLNKLLGQPCIQQESPASIKLLHDTTKEAIMGLQGMGISTLTWDSFLVHITLKKLDRSTHNLYEQSLKAPRELQTISDLLQFLELRFQALETLGKDKRQQPVDKMLKRNNQVNPMSFISTSRKCVLCGSTHPLFACKKFTELSPLERLNVVRKHKHCINCLKIGHMSLKCQSRGCLKCSKKHNTLLHIGNTAKVSHHDMTSDGDSAHAPASHPLASTSNPSILAAQSMTGEKGYVLLSTVIIKLVNHKGETIECRAILDSGSQLNFITDKMAKKLGLNRTPDSLCIEGIGEIKQRAQHRVSVLVQSKITAFSTRLEAVILPQITTDQPTQTLNIATWRIPQNIELADPDFYHPGSIDFLIGAEVYYQLLSVGQIKLGETLPTLQNTLLGWVVAGKTQDVSRHLATCGICNREDDNLNDQLEKFWKLEDVTPTVRAMTDSEVKCETHFSQTVRRDSTGRFVVKLPFVHDPQKLGDSKDVALRRFLALERKLNKNPQIKEQYIEFMSEYLRLGHMEEVNGSAIAKPHYFLPHHCVMKPNSTTTKLRVVFDASSKTSTNVSLNEILATGPTIQDELVSILLRFRLPRFVFTADIEKMYRQITVDNDDRRYQMIAWRDDSSQPIKHYQLCTVTYGTTSAPYLATKCLQRLSLQEEQKYPLGSDALRRNFYVDDVMTGSDNLREARDMQEQLQQLLQSAGFKLRKWCANHAQLLLSIPHEDRALQLDFHNGDDDEHINALGLTWHPKSDEFRIRAMGPDKGKITKRTVLSDIAHLFDPLGLVSPVIVTAKIFLQKLWELKLDWDAALPLELHTTWAEFRQNLKMLNDIRIPRHMFAGKTPRTRQLHAFCDASEKAFGAAVYIRSTNDDGTVTVKLICAKSRVAPTKKVTLPRLELCAAKLAAQLVQRIKKDLNWNDQPCLFWTDSEIVLAWLKAESSSFHTFVANRVAAIQEVTSINQWRHVPSKQNAADVLSRGISPERLKACTTWFYGPVFLHGVEASWPAQRAQHDTDLEKKRPRSIVIAASRTSNIIHDINHKNSFRTLQRVIAYVLRFIKNCQQHNSLRRERSQLTVKEMEEALVVIVRNTQVEGFKDELSQLKHTKMVKANSNLSSLSPFLDDDGIIRVGGRLQASNLPFDAKHPMLLPYAHNITRLLMTQLHTNNLHAGPQTLLSITRQRFWPIKAKTTARSIVQNCVRCTKSKPRLLSQLMGNLPPTRVQPARPFVNSGVDFCGPFWTHFKSRGKRPQKSYVAVFCCFATKAVHLELVSDLTRDAFIGSLKRFMSRRGNCRNLYCDNATNFVGAKNQLAELKEAVYSQESRHNITAFCTTRGVDFQFIPPRAPHFGGLWEAAVKSAKNLFQRSAASASLTYEELETLMVEIEAILNSRPLTPQSADPNDMSALTPGHFLIGEPLTNTIDPHAQTAKGSLLQRWKLVTHIKNEFWRRWTIEYLNELQHRYKWKQKCDNARNGMMVLIKDDNLPSMKWPLGRIIKVIKGQDDLVRVADVKTATGVLRRPIHKLAPLPIDKEGESSMVIQDNPASQSEAKESKLRKRPSFQDVAHTTSNHSKINPGGSSKDEPTSSSSSTKRRRSGTSAISLLLLSALILPILGDTEVKITPFKSQPGLYFEGMGATQLVSNEWNLVVFYDLKAFWKEFDSIQGAATRLVSTCNGMKGKQACTTMVEQFANLMLELRNNNELLMPRTQPRQRRAPLDIVGNLANSLFGVLDSKYAEKMSQIINNLEGNDEHLLALIKNQTSLIDSTTNIMKKSQANMEKQLQEFDKYINQTIIAVNNISQELHEQRSAEIINSLSVQLLVMAINYQRVQSALLDVIIDIHHGKVNPQLLTPKQLQAELTLIKEHLPSTLRLPSRRENLLELYGLMTTEGHIGQNQVIFRLKLPLFSYETFEMMRIVPVPFLMNDTFLAIKPDSEFLIVNLHRDQYYPLSEHELSACKNIGSSIYMCRQHHPLYRKGSNISSCEISLLSHSSSSPNCKLMNAINASPWIQLLNPNHWIFSTRRPITINIVCGTSVSQQILEESGILEVKNGCAIKEEFVTIRSHNIYPSTLTTSFVPSKNLTAILQPIKGNPLVHRIASVESLANDIQTLQRRIQAQQSEESALKIHHHDAHHFTLGYMSLLIIISIFCYLLWRCISSRRHKSRSKPPIPAPRTSSVSDFQLSSDIHI